MTIFKYILTAVCAYFLGSVSVSVLLSRGVMNTDVRAHGSGNAGATNMARVFGLRMGVVTLAGDMLKAALAMLAGFALLGENGMCVAGALCLVGHCYPALHEFRGGKGVAVMAGFAFGFHISILPVAALAFFVPFLLTHYVSLGSLCVYAVSFLAVAVEGAMGMYHVAGPAALVEMDVIMGILTAMAFWRHRSNIGRLRAGNERKMYLTKSSDAAKEES